MLRESDAPSHALLTHRLNQGFSLLWLRAFGSGYPLSQESGPQKRYPKTPQHHEKRQDVQTRVWTDRIKRRFFYQVSRLEQESSAEQKIREDDDNLKEKRRVTFCSLRPSSSLPPTTRHDAWPSCGLEPRSRCASRGHID